MPTNRKFVQNQVTTLAGAGVSMGDTSMTLTKFQTIEGVNLTMADFGTKGRGTNQPAEGQYEEQISFTGITQNGDDTATLTGIFHVSNEYPYTETSGFSQDHVGGTAFVISNTAGFYGEFANKLNDEDITGVKWTVDDPTIARQIVNKEYVDNIAINGAVPATETVPGISMAANAADISNSNDQRPYNLEQYFLFVRPSQIYNVGTRAFLAAANISSHDAVYMKSYTPSGGITLDNNLTFNGQVTAFPSTTGPQTYSQNYTVGNISNGMMIVSVTSFVNNASTTNPGPIGDAFYNGIQMTLVDDISYAINLGSGSTQQYVRTFILANPPTGTHSLQVTVTTSSVFSGMTTFNIPTSIATYANVASSISNHGYTIWTNNYPNPTVPVSNSLSTSTNSEVVWSMNSGYAGASSAFSAGAQNNISNSVAGVYTGDSGVLPAPTTNIATTSVSSTPYGTVVASIALAPANAATFGLDRASAATTATEFTFIGFAPIGGAQNSNVSVITTGYIDGFTSLIPGVRYFLSDTPGQISTTAGTVSKVVGIAVSPTTLLIENRN